MNWIKKHYDQFLVALFALALVAVSVLIFLQTKSFSDSFSEAQATVVPSEKVPDLDLEKVKLAEKQIAEPIKWQPTAGANEFLFVPAYYMINSAGLPERPESGSRYQDTLTGAPIPNKFFTDNKLPLLDPSVPTQDPDGDGFNNEDEWRGSRDPKDPTKWSGSTDPNDPQSFPPYVTKLFLREWIKVPFVLLFQAYDGNPKKPQEMTFQINAAGRSRKTEFLKLGETVSGGPGSSPYKLEKFEFKEATNASTGAKEDVSELTLIRTDMNEAVVLVLGRATNSPDSYASFDYKFRDYKLQGVKKLGDFVLQPEKEKRYKLIDITDAGALIRLPDGSEYLVIVDPRAPKR